ncbi:growth-regulating factor 6-like [Magnolia sinica]|uniref:growth-regulating factor 6-like n=1 Tax=Magnolia sinica TaxID=86752 RepID=UPI00265ABFE2|nr:growth-regulating factor 6-like [Magnolia sinica]
MDFGVLGLDGNEGGLSHLVSEAEARQRGFGSGFLKQGRSGVVEDEWMGLKMARNDDGGVSKPMLVQSKGPLLRSNSLFSDGGQQQLLLSFSSPKSDGGLVSSEGVVERSYQNGSLGCYNTSSIYARNAGLASGGMHGVLAGVRGPFTPSQWMELEHQALIYKYLNANVPIPSNLLIPIRKSLNPSGFSGFSAGSFRPNTWGWGSFHLGFTGNTDPEPGRCRRTDGKKWRCSRDAVADQKYCERHMNRGRHRSRKPVEGQIGHASSGMAAATKAMAIASSAASAASISCPANSDALAHQQTKSLQTGADPSVTPMSRILMNKSNVDDRIQDSQTLSMLSSIPLKSKEVQFTIPKEHLAFEEEYSKMESGLVSSNSLLNMQRSSYVESGNFHTSHDLNDREPQSHPFRHFIDDWPKSRSDHSAITWPEVDEVRSDRTQLSISIPVTSSDFSSSTSSPTQEKLTLSPLKLSREFDPVQMGLGVGGTLNDAAQRQASWIPISWETSMGGPLGEALNNANNTPTDQKYSASALNLMTEGWDASPRLRSSPTDVLQKTTFTSISNSSSGSSPRAENNKACDHTSLCDNLYGSAFVNSTIPLL